MAWGLTNKGSGFRVTPRVLPGRSRASKLRKKEKRIVAEMEDLGHIKFWPLDLGPRITAPHVPASSWRMVSMSFTIILYPSQEPAEIPISPKTDAT